METASARDAWNDRYSASDYVWTIKVNQFVEQHLAGLPPGTAIDLGAGEGRNAVWLAQKGWEVTAVDFSPVGLEKGRRLAEDHNVAVDFVEGDATSWQPDGPVNLVLLSYLQLEAPGRQIVLEHARSWLRPGGMVFVIAHDASNVTDGYGGPPSAGVCYRVDETVAGLAGLDIAVAEVMERVVATEAGEQVALDTLVIARRPN